MENALNTYIGSGVIFPITLNSVGKPVISTGTELIESNLKILLTWPLLDRFFTNSYGTRLVELLEEPNDEITLDIIRRFIIEAITDWEPKISLVSVIPTIDSGKLSIKLIYNITNTSIQKETEITI